MELNDDWIELDDALDDDWMGLNDVISDDQVTWWLLNG